MQTNASFHMIIQFCLPPLDIITLISFLESFTNYSNMKTILIIALVFSAILTITQALSCLPCHQVTCHSLSKLNCKGGLTRNVCNCCTACAKVKGEKCGGPWNINGVCDCGLRCYKSPRNIKRLGEFNASGICIRWVITLCMNDTDFRM